MPRRYGAPVGCCRPERRRSSITGTLSPIAAGLACRCPACGRGRLFKGYLSLRSPCEACGVDLSLHDNDDGPAAFLILVVGFVNVFGALIVEARYAPPAWVHFAIWVPLTIVSVLVLLRSFKGVRVALQYKNRAAESEAPSRPDQLGDRRTSRHS